MCARALARAAAPLGGTARRSARACALRAGAYFKVTTAHAYTTQRAARRATVLNLLVVSYFKVLQFKVPVLYTQFSIVC